MSYDIGMSVYSYGQQASYFGYTMNYAMQARFGNLPGKFGINDAF